MKKKKILSIILIEVLSIISLILLTYYFTPEQSLYHPSEIIYKDEDNNTFLTTLNDKNGEYTYYNEIPQSFINNLITIEDKHFFSHKGFDFFRIFSSIINNIFSDNSLQGASTITMQLARLLFLNQNQTLKRKITELFIAIKIEKNYTKEQILEFYLNKVYFAHGIYGLKNASHFYFNKEIINLTLKEQAILISIINAPNIYSPIINKEASLNKAKTILRTLKDNNTITIKEYYEALFEELTLTNNIASNKYPYYIDSIKEEIEKNNIIESTKYNHGITIKSFLNVNLQNYIENMIKNISFNNSNVAVCIMKVNSGEVVALIGGKDYEESSFNRALHAKKQIGSTIKPLLYYLALDKGLNPLSEFTSKKTTFKLDENTYYEVSNASNIYANRKITMLEAIAMSDNIYAMKTLLLVGKDKLINLINYFNMNVDVKNETLALGSNTLTPLELTSIYNTIASNGTYYTPKFIDELSLTDDFLLYKYSTTKKQILNKKTNSILQFMLRSPFDESLKTYSKPSLMNYYISYSFAGKTGTTSSSSYVIGFNTSYTIGVYVGTDDNSELFNGYLAKEIFYNIAKYVDKNEGFFEKPSSTKSFTIYNKSLNKRSFEYIY